MEISRPFLESIAKEQGFNKFGIGTIERYGDTCIDRGEEIVVRSSDGGDRRIERRFTTKDDWHRYLDQFRE